MKRRLAVDPLKISKGCRELNPHLFIETARCKTDSAQRDAADNGSRSQDGQGVIVSSTKGKRRKQMNRTEAEFARILQARCDRDEIVSFDYEGLTLRWADGMRYTPDFMVVKSITRTPRQSDDEFPHVQLVLIEVKGAFGWQKDIVKFRAARANWPLYEFQFWQKLNGEWQQTR